MKRTGILLSSLLLTLSLWAQPQKKTTQPKTQETDMNKLLEDAMKAEGMSPKEQEEIRKYMKDMLPAMQEQNATMADYPSFSNNGELVPRKDPLRIAALSKKALAKAEVSAYANGLYTKMMARIDAAEVAIVKKVVSMTPKAADIGSASLLAMLQGHPHAALALSIKAVISDPSNLNWQNNMAALLTSYGYPEQAMPLLRKLQADLPVNSTVLNNLGQAWLGLGELDSAKRFFDFAYRANPLHPEASLCGGLMEELKGDPFKAGEEYKNAMENSPNHFTEQLVKNHDKNYKPGDVDFEKLKKMIAIYEYFPANWIPELPKLSNDVRKYNEDYGTKKSYARMIKEFTKMVEEKINLLSMGLEDLANKGEETFVKEMMMENQKGLSFMSKPATIILIALHSYQANKQLEHAEELKKIHSWVTGLHQVKQKKIDAIYKQIRDSKGTTCENYKSQLDELENNYMREVNTRVRSYLEKTTEEFRQWLNAYCTWNWYVTGNPKNVILIQDYGATAYMAELYGGIVDAMVTLPEHCSPRSYEVAVEFKAPEIPNFTCPAVVSIPAGPDWQQLVASAKNFDDNKYGIKKTNKPVPNVSVATGSGKMVAQPGVSPFYKTANGGITPGGADVEAAMDKGLMNAFRKVNGKKKATDQQVGDAVDKGLSDAMKRMQERRKQGVLGDDDELVPLPVIPPDDELVPLPKIPLDDMDPLDRKLLNKYKLHKELMDKMLTADCSNVKSAKDNLREQLDRMNKKIRESDAFERMMQEIKKLENEIVQKEEDRAKRENLLKKMAEMERMSLELESYEQMNEFLKNAERINKEMEAMDDKKIYWEKAQKMMKAIDEMDATPAAIREIQTNGLQPSISSGLQAPGTFVPNKTLFQ